MTHTTPELSSACKCIYCDSTEYLSIDFEDRISNYAFVRCVFCGAEGPSCFHSSYEKAMEGAVHKWNIFAVFLNLEVSMY